tara:strand:- start:197 stop:1150 length:954 start_codon:yes stop_codon:yes gene_type:complete
MKYNLKIVNGAHHEYNVIIFLLTNIFPEYNIPDSHNVNNPKFILGISANLDNKLNGKKDGKMTYYLDETVKIPYLFWTGESFDVEVKSKTGKHKYLIISSLSSNPETVKMPFASFWYIQFYLNDYLTKYRNKTYFKKTEYLAYCSTKNTPERNQFMNLLIERSNNPKNIHCLGKCKYKECLNKEIKRTTPPNTLLIDEYSKYKFVLTMENSNVKGYVTEKILCALVAGSIPIYWGDHHYAKKLFNPNAFICIQDFENFELCIDYILNMKDEDIQRMLFEPIFKDNIPSPEFDITNFSDNSFYGNLKKKIRNMCIETI